MFIHKLNANSLRCEAYREVDRFSILSPKKAKTRTDIVINISLQEHLNLKVC
ncbi:MAG: hypothetical protein JWO44_2501 [Bacteroidetes bacterium]|nr:hypothetical protein [Bacteroidota bacterium]